MHKIKVSLKNDSYDIIAGVNIIGSLAGRLDELGLSKDAYVITNSLIKKRHGRILAGALGKGGFKVRFKLVPDTEKAKSIAILPALLKDLVFYDKRKKPFIVAFGGGVVGDVAGFLASIYKRGVPYIQVPTTLLAQVDSAIGGKTAVDLAEAKNLVGAFYQPRLVFSEVGFLKTLSQRQLRSGLAEVIKYGAISDPALFAYIEKNLKSILAARAASLEHIVECSSRIKAGIVGRDEKEKKGIRTILNFGHTFGHAIEAASGYTAYSHGEAIALGMLVACDISLRLKLCRPDTCERIGILIKRAGLPTRAKSVSLSAIMNAYYRDKKFSGTKNRLVLLRDIGKARVVEDIAPAVVKSALKNLLANHSLT